MKVLFSILPLAFSSSCDNVIPLMSLYSGGLDLTNVEPNTIPLESLRADVLHWTCANGNKYNGYDIPDQVIGFRPVPSSGCEIEVWTEEFLFNASEHLTVTMSKSYFFGLMSSSKSMSEAMSAQISQGGIVGMASCSVTTYDVILAPEWMLQPGDYLKQALIHYVGSASGCVNFDKSSVAAYNEIISLFGTGRIANGTVGGVAQLFFASERVVTNFMASGDIGLSARGSLFNLISAAGGASGHAEVNVNFNTTLAYGYGRTRGGDFSPFGSTDKWQEWEKSVFDHPAVVDLQTANLSSLVSQWNQSCGEKLHLAEVNHRVRAYLSDELIPILNVIETYLNRWTWPTCVYGKNKNSCSPLKLLTNVRALRTKITDELAHSLITSELRAAVYTGEVAALVSILPKLPPKAEVRSWGWTHSGKIPFAAYCGLSEMEVGFNSDVGNQMLVVQPGSEAPSGGYSSWTYQSGGNYGTGTTACIIYVVAADMVTGEGPRVFELGGQKSKILGKFWFCAITKAQAGFNSKIGDSYMQVVKNENDEWQYSATNHCPDMAAVSCLTSPPPGVPEDMTSYTGIKSGTSLGIHFLCMLSGVKYGHNTDIGNKYASVKQNNSGDWIYTDTQGEAGGVVCIG